MVEEAAASPSAAQLGLALALALPLPCQTPVNQEVNIVSGLKRSLKRSKTRLPMAQQRSSSRLAENRRRGKCLLVPRRRGLPALRHVPLGWRLLHLPLEGRNESPAAAAAAVAVPMEVLALRRQVPHRRTTRRDSCLAAALRPAEQLALLTCRWIECCGRLCRRMLQLGRRLARRWQRRCRFLGGHAAIIFQLYDVCGHVRSSETATRCTSYFCQSCLSAEPRSRDRVLAGWTQPPAQRRHHFARQPAMPSAARWGCAQQSVLVCWHYASGVRHCRLHH